MKVPPTVFTQGNIPGTLFCYRLSRLQDHNAAGKSMSMINSNRTRDLPACSAIPQPTAPPRALFLLYYEKFHYSYMPI